MGLILWSLFGRGSTARGLTGLATTLILTSVANGQTVDRQTLHTFAMDVLESIQAPSIADDLEYCGLIGFDRFGNLTATEARRGKKSGCKISGKPRRFKAIATYHSHGAYNRRADTEVPSVQDLKHDFRQKLHGYVGTPGGRVWFNDKTEEQTILLCGPGCIETDLNYRECEATKPRNLYTIKSLKWREKNVNGPC